MPIYALGAAEPDIHSMAFVHPDAVVIGLVHIGADSTIWPTAVLRGDDGDTHIGAGSVIGGNVWLLKSTPPNSVAYYKGDDLVIRERQQQETLIMEPGEFTI